MTGQSYDVSGSENVSCISDYPVATRAHTFTGSCTTSRPGSTVLAYLILSPIISNSQDSLLSGVDDHGAPTMVHNCSLHRHTSPLRLFLCAIFDQTEQYKTLSYKD